MYPNHTCKISNYTIEPDGGFYHLYLSEENQLETGIKRCLATTHTIAEIIGYIEHKQSNLHDTDILIEFADKPKFYYEWIIVYNNINGQFVLFEVKNQDRVAKDEDIDIDDLVNRHKDKNLILQF